MIANALLASSSGPTVVSSLQGRATAPTVDVTHSSRGIDATCFMEIQPVIYQKKVPDTSENGAYTRNHEQILPMI